jgi:hypothetical protein
VIDEVWRARCREGHDFSRAVKDGSLLALAAEGLRKYS